jgi:hypothetical protein
VNEIIATGNWPVKFLLETGKKPQKW